MAGDSPRRREFPQTRWTLIHRATAPRSEEALAALGVLLQRYLPALKAHLVNLKRLPPHRADDLVQGFVTDKVLQGDLLAKANKAKGTFRSFLLTTFDRYVISVFRKEQAAKRAPEGGHVDVDEFAELLSSGENAVAAFDLEWVQQVVQQALARVKEECEASGRAAFWKLFQNRVVAPALEGAKPDSYADLIKELGFKSPLQASNALLTAKRIFQREFKAVIADYSGSPEELDEEISELRAILAALSA